MSLWSALGRRFRHDDTRWVVLDVESTGLDVERDRLVAIAAVGVSIRGARLRIDVQDSFEVVLRHDAAVVDKANILLHGIGVGAQRVGTAPPLALEAFERWVGASPLIAFHTAFDEAMIQRAMKALLGRRLPNPWLDLEHVAEVVCPGVPARSLDEWLAHFGIPCMVRHQAAADTLATAELLIRIYPAAIVQRGPEGFAGLVKLGAQRKWLRAH